MSGSSLTRAYQSELVKNMTSARSVVLGASEAQRLRRERRSSSPMRRVISNAE